MLDVNEAGRCLRGGLTLFILLLAFRYMLLPTLVDWLKKETVMQENLDLSEALPQGTSTSLRASNGEIVSRVDLDRVAGLTGQFAQDEGVLLAKAALAGDQAALDEFHAGVGLVLSSVTDHDEGEGVRLVMHEMDEKIDGREGHQRGAVRACFEAGGARIDAAELVAWILSPEGRAALDNRGITVPVLATDLPAGTLTPEEAILAARNVGVDLTCGECAAEFYTGYPATLSGPREHEPYCKTIMNLRLAGADTDGAGWQRDAPPHGVCCLVTTLAASGERGVTLGVLAPDHEGTAWFSHGERLQGVIAWMKLPVAAKDEVPL